MRRLRLFDEAAGNLCPHAAGGPGDDAILPVSLAMAWALRNADAPHSVGTGRWFGNRSSGRPI